MSEDGNDRRDPEEEEPSFSERQFQRTLKWAFGEIRTPKSKRFHMWVNVAIWSGILAWGGLMATVVIKLVRQNLSADVLRTLDFVQYSCWAVLITAWFIVPTRCFIRYGSRFGTPASDKDQNAEG